MKAGISARPLPAAPQIPAPDHARAHALRVAENYAADSSGAACRAPDLRALP